MMFQKIVKRIYLIILELVLITMIFVMNGELDAMYILIYVAMVYANTILIIDLYNSK